MKRFNTLKKLKQILTKREITLSFLVIALSLLTGLAQSASIVLVLPFINIVLNPVIIQENEFLLWIARTFGLERTLTFLIVFGSFIFMAVIASNMLMIVTIYAKSKFVMMRTHHISKKLLNKYLRAPYSFYLKRNSSELSKNVLNEVHQFTQGFLMALFDILTNGVMLLVVLVTIIIIDPTASITAVIIFGGMFGGLMLFFRRRLEAKGKERFLANQEKFKTTTEALASIKTTKVLGAEKHFLDLYDKASLSFSKSNVYATVVGSVPRHIIEAIAFGGLVLFVVIQLSLGRALDALVPIVGVLGLAGYRMLPALQMVFAQYSNVLYNLPIVDKIYEDLIEASEYDPLALESASSAIPYQNSITLNNVHFKYLKDATFGLQAIDIKILKNQMVGFVGQTGSGKSTLIDIVMGLLKPIEGTLKVDNAIIDNNNTRNWQSMIGYVPQEIYLSDASLKHNIAFGVDDEAIDLEKVKAAAKIAAIDEFIETELPLKYDTFVGERGVRLSGGQRQRIGIARALYRDPEVIVFDEATSALDNKTEKDVLKAINNAAINRTVIMIAHRLNTLKDCDVIFKLDHGKLIKKGTYKEIVED